MSIFFLFKSPLFHGFSVDSPGYPSHLRGHLAGLTGSDLTYVSSRAYGAHGDVFLLWSPYNHISEYVYIYICIFAIIIIYHISTKI